MAGLAGVRPRPRNLVRSVSYSVSVVATFGKRELPRPDPHLLREVGVVPKRTATWYKLRLRKSFAKAGWADQHGERSGNFRIARHFEFTALMAVIDQRHNP
jgi:hypothetical protein